MEITLACDLFTSGLAITDRLDVVFLLETPGRATGRWPR